MSAMGPGAARARVRMIGKATVMPKLWTRSRGPASQQHTRRLQLMGRSTRSLRACGPHVISVFITRYIITITAEEVRRERNGMRGKAEVVRASSRRWKEETGTRTGMRRSLSTAVVGRRTIGGATR